MTDTINTLADPGSDPPHEWQQPENAQTILHPITPASLRAHADWMDGDDGQAWEGSRALRLRAARLEAESARDEEAERLAKVHHEAGYIAEWDALHPETRDGLVAQMRAVLDRLAADGRLLPEGGTVPRVGVKPIGWYRSMDADFASEHFDFPMYGDGTHEAADGGKWVWDERMQVWELREYPPAVSVLDSGPRTWDHLNKVPRDVEVTGGPRDHPAAWMSDELGLAEADWRWKTNGAIVPVIYWSGTWTEFIPDSGPDGTPEKPEKWAVLNPDTNTIGPEVFWSWDEADKRGGYGRVVRVDGDKA